MTTNPFEITKAVDFTDSEIESNYIAFGGPGHRIVDPRSPMPQFLIGGKGGGRTHLMRHYAYTLQRARSAANASRSALEEIQADGYLGIYFRCSGLNGSRFVGKSQPIEVWDDVYAYYMDLWVTELLLGTLLDLNSDAQWDDAHQEALAARVASALSFDIRADASSSPLEQAHRGVGQLRGELDRAVNNAALTRVLDVEIRSNRGALIFETAAATVELLPGLRDVKIAFLVDEYENLSKRQQRYFNTLLREKEPSCTFLVGGRMWGIRTHKTLSAGETNKQGSEYEEIVMEDAYRVEPQEYEAFCRRLVEARLNEAGLNESEVQSWFRRLNGDPDNRFLDAQLTEVLRGRDPAERPHLIQLRAAVQRATGSVQAAEQITRALAFPEHPLLEKLGILRFYLRWSSTRSPNLQLAQQARDEMQTLALGTESVELGNFFKQRKSDAVAQIYRDMDRRHLYTGFDQFVTMSGYLPRSLLMILKYVTRWATFLGEDPVRGSTPISARAMSTGVRDAATWFFEDAKPMGVEGERCEIAINRLGGFLSAVRHADKPTEINVSTFSSNLQGASDASVEMLKICVQRGLLVEVPYGRASRNSGPVHRRFQLHPMLTPIWSLSPARRGDHTLSGDIVTAIFDPDAPEAEFLRLQAVRLRPMTAPFVPEQLSQREALFDFD